MKNKLNSNQQLKRKLRASKEWKEKRQQVRENQKIDPITLNPLTKSFNLHHLSQSKKIEDYTNLEDERFVGLNAQSHDCLHFLYRIYEREDNFDMLERIKELLIKMKEFTDKDRRNND